MASRNSLAVYEESYSVLDLAFSELLASDSVLSLTVLDRLS